MRNENVQLERVRVRVLPHGHVRPADAARYPDYSEKTLANKEAKGEGPTPLKSAALPAVDRLLASGTAAP